MHYHHHQYQYRRAKLIAAEKRRRAAIKLRTVIVIPTVSSASMTFLRPSKLDPSNTVPDIDLQDMLNARYVAKAIAKLEAIMPSTAT